jgi:hypothetical protein
MSKIHLVDFFCIGAKKIRNSTKREGPSIKIQKRRKFLSGFGAMQKLRKFSPLLYLLKFIIYYKLCFRGA